MASERVIKNIRKFTKRRRTFSFLSEKCTGLDEALELQVLRWRTTELVYTRIQIYLKKLYTLLEENEIIEKFTERIKHPKNNISTKEMKRVVFRASVKFTRWFFKKLIKKIFASTDKHRSVIDINKNWVIFNHNFGYQRIYDGYEPKDM